MSENDGNADKKPSVGQAVATFVRALVKKIPIVGEPLSQLPMAFLGAILIWGAIYPVFVVFGVLTAIQFLPARVQAPVEAYIRNSVGSHADGVQALNASNRIIDGSTPMSFRFAQDAASDDTFYQLVDKGQAIDFVSYERRERGASRDLTCANLDPPDNQTIGQILISATDSEFKRRIDVTGSFNRARRERGITEDDWKEDENLKAAQQVQFVVTFQPNPEFRNSPYVKCFPISVYLYMIFRKPAVAA